MHLILGATALARSILILLDLDKPPTLPVIILISATHLTPANDLALVLLNVATTMLISMIGMSDLVAQGASVMEDRRMKQIMIMSVIH